MSALAQLLQRHRSLSIVMVLTLGSQALSAASSLALRLLGLPVADTYAVAAQIGLTGFTGVTVGILYNIAIGRPDFSTWRKWAVLAASVSVGSAALQGCILSATGFVASHGTAFVWAVFCMFGVGGALISTAATRGVHLACQGKPVLFASVTVLPNAGYAMGIVISALTHTDLAPAAGWLLASAVLLVWSRRFIPVLHPLSPHSALPATLERTVDPLRSQVTGLLLGVIASTFMPMLFLAALSQSAVGVVYLATLISRIVNAAVALTVNSALLVRFTWSADEAEIGRTPTALSAGFVAGMILSGIGGAATHSPIVSGTIMVAAWLVGVIASAVLTRHLNARRRGRAVLVKSIVETVLTAAAAVALFVWPSFDGYFACFAVSAATTITVGGIALRRPAWIVIGLVGLLGATFVLLGGQAHA